MNECRNFGARKVRYLRQGWGFPNITARVSPVWVYMQPQSPIAVDLGCCGVLFRNLPLRQGTQGKLPKRVSSINIKKEKTNEANFTYFTFPLIRHSVLIHYLEVGRV
jgi:hypothetical protein